MKRFILSALLALGVPTAQVEAQSALPIAVVVETCAEVGIFGPAGRSAPLTVNEDGELCLAGGGGGVSELTAGANIELTPDPIIDTGTIAAIPSGSDTQVQFNDAGAFGGDSGMVFNKTTNALTLLGVLAASNGTIATGTITTSQPMTLTQTWNDGAVTFTGFKVNVTNTASASASLLMDLQAGGSTLVNIDRGGTLRGLGLRGTNLLVQLAGTIAFSNSNDNNGTADTVLVRDAANTLAQRNGTSAQALRVYNTFTDASNYERGFAQWSANVFQIGNQQAGSGSARNVLLQSAAELLLNSVDGIIRLQFNGGNGAILNFGALSKIIGSTDGNILLSNQAGTGFGLLQFGSSTSSFPALKRSATILQARLADDSANAAFEATTIDTDGFAIGSLPAPGVAGRRAYVTDQITACPVPGTAPTAGGALVCPVFDNGVAWVGG